METNVAQLPLTDRLWGWLEANKTQAAIFAAVLLVVGLVVWIVVWQGHQREQAAGEALSSLAVEQMLSPGRPNSADGYLKLASQYPKSEAGARALLLAAGSLFTDGKYSDAQAQFEKFTREHRESSLMGEALLGIAASLEAQGKTDAAVAAYKELISRHAGDSVVPDAKFALARLYEVQNKPELARDLYLEVERDGRFSSKAIEAGMRVEDLMAKYPKLAPLTASPVSALPVPMTNFTIKPSAATNVSPKPAGVSNPPVAPIITTNK
jgi:predicted negative regulator of RcsB-dependent stress response